MAIKNFDDWAFSSGYTPLSDALYRNGNDDRFTTDYLHRQYNWYAQQQRVADTGANSNLMVDVEALKSDPATVTAALIRQQSAEYDSTFKPIEDQLLQMTTFKNPELLNKELSGAIGNNGTGGYINQTLDSVFSAQGRNSSRYGANMTAEQQDALANSNNLKRSTAVVDAATRIRQKLQERDQQIMMGMGNGISAATAAAQ